MKITNQHNQTFGTFCGDRTGEVVYVTSGYYAVVTFHSDGVIGGPGYKLIFSHVPQGKINFSYVLFDNWKIRSSQKTRDARGKVHG